MPAATTIALGIGAASGLYQTIDGAVKKKKYQDAIDDFKTQDLTNPYKEMKVSTLKADQQTDQNLSTSASAIDTLQRAGARTLLSGLPKVQENSVLVQNMISQDLEKQDVRRQQLIAQGEERIRSIREQREQNALLGLGQGLQTARQDMFSGLTNLASTGLAADSLLKTRPPHINDFATPISKQNISPVTMQTSPLSLPSEIKL